MIPECSVLLLSACMAVIFTLYVEPMLAVFLNTTFSLSNTAIGIFFLCSAVTYIVGSPLSSYLSSRMNRRFIIIFSFSMMTLESTLMGPSQLLGLPTTLPIVATGNAIIGFALAMALIPLLSELIEVLESRKRFEPAQINDMSSALFNSMFNVGNVFSPLIAGALHDAYGYQFTTDTMMVVSLIYLIFLIVTLTSSRKKKKGAHK